MALRVATLSHGLGKDSKLTTCRRVNNGNDRKQSLKQYHHQQGGEYHLFDETKSLKGFLLTVQAFQSHRKEFVVYQ